MPENKLLVDFCRYIIINAVVICTFVTGGHSKPAQSTKQNDFGTLDIRNGQIITGYIGCLFSKRLCEQETEWCYNDGVFGRCLSESGVLDNESLYRYDLSKGDAHAVEREMEKLFALGYRWGHLYTQCVLQTLLESIRRGFTWDQSVCGDVQDQDLKGALRAFEDDIDPKNLAFIKFHPSDPHAEYADESYKPPKGLTHLQETPLVEGKEKIYDTNEVSKSKASEQLKKQTIDISAGKFGEPLAGNGDQRLMEEELANAVEKTKNKNGGNSKNGKNKQNKNKNKGKAERKPIVKKSVLNMEYPFDLTSLSSTSQSDKSSKMVAGNIQHSMSSGSRGLDAHNAASQTGLLREWNSLPIDDDVELPAVLQPKIFSSFYNTPDLFRYGVESKDQTPSNPVLQNSNDYERLLDDGTLGGYDIQAALQTELARREEQEQIRKAAAQLEAALASDSFLRSRLESSVADNDAGQGLDINELSLGDGDDEKLEFILPAQYKLPVTSKGSTSQLSQLQFLPPSLIDRSGFAGNSLYNSPYISNNQNYDDLQNDDPDQDDRSLMYTEGGLVFLNNGKNKNILNDFPNTGNREPLVPVGQPDDLGFYDVPFTKEDQESLMYLKRGQPRDELELIRRDRENPESGLESSDLLLLDNPENSVDLGRNGYEELSSFLLGENYGGGNMGFERQERLDVKKPGPWYRTVNNYAFDKEDKFLNNIQPEISEVTYRQGPEDMMRDDPNDNAMRQGLPAKHDKDSVLARLESIGMDKKSVPVLFDNTWNKHSKNIELVDTSYVNLELDTSANWNGAEELVDSLPEILKVDRNLFKHVPVKQSNYVTFKVMKNSEGLNATTIAQEIEKVKEKIEQQHDIKILKIDVGRSADSNIPSAMYLEQDPASNKMFIATFAVCGLVAAVLVAAVALFLVRKHAKSKEKIVRLSQEDPSYEACKDYQDLCRTRMAASKNNEKMEPLRGPTHKIASKDSENGSSSSRSSTSSWSEEPVLTNMDISTGHMVLSYMEDHLKNRDRMDREWAALSAYEADPCSTAVAEKPETAKKSRYSNSLPFDHSRVILNDLANVSGTDYINASTITDHDPRNPAYIATQGPLPNTVADFWQMVWEQGSVVIVNLTRLTENGQALCHRYWPEEGSELHHIYEVHLVSEHIWCDEYLVRSFYLKNLKTGETRTVTQFHFLAWPESGIPQSTKALLEFRRKVNKSYRGRSCPIIVHCSDGSGRTGTYCLIDMVLNRMSKGAKEIDIAATLEHIRDQRPNMVRTKQQFEFVLMAVAEEVHAILKALPQ